MVEQVVLRTQVMVQVLVLVVEQVIQVVNKTKVILMEQVDY